MRYNILVIAPNWIGDIILSIPAIESLKKKMPDAVITVMAGRHGCELLGSLPYIDKTILSPASWNDVLKFLVSKKDIHYDIAYIFPNSFKSALLAFFSRAKDRVGCNTEFRGIILTHRLPPRTSNYTHVADHFMQIVGYNKGINNRDTAKGLVLPLRYEDIRYAREAIGVSKIERNRLLIAIHPGASKIERAWHIDRFIALCQKLLEEYNIFFLILGSKKEDAMLSKFSAVINKRDAHICSGIERITYVAAMISLCDLFIGNDSGIMHLASAVGVPVVGIFGPGIKEQTGPILPEDKYEIISKKYPCSPCRQRFFRECSLSINGKPPCISAIDVSDVLKGVKTIIQRLRLDSIKRHKKDIEKEIKASTLPFGHI